MDEYDGRQYVGIDLHRRRSVIVRMTPDGQRIGLRFEAAQAQAVAYSRDVDARRLAFAAGEAEAVEWFVDRLLKSSRYPQGFPRRWQVAYRPENRDVVVEFGLPPQEVVPAVREYRYIKSRD